MTNKEIVVKFIDEVFNKWDVSKLDDFMHDDYKQHNPNSEDGKAGFIKFTEHFFALKPHMDIVMMGENEDCVFVFFKCTLGDGSGHENKVCDIYRLRDGKLAEHWDVVEHNVENIVPVHNNGLF